MLYVRGVTTQPSLFTSVYNAAMRLRTTGCPESTITRERTFMNSHALLGSLASYHLKRKAVPTDQCVSPVGCPVQSAHDGNPVYHVSCLRGRILAYSKKEQTANTSMRPPTLKSSDLEVMHKKYLSSFPMRYLVSRLLRSPNVHHEILCVSTVERPV